MHSACSSTGPSPGSTFLAERIAKVSNVGTKAAFCMTRRLPCGVFRFDVGPRSVMSRISKARPPSADGTTTRSLKPPRQTARSPSTAGSSSTSICDGSTAFAITRQFVSAADRSAANTPCKVIPTAPKMAVATLPSSVATAFLRDCKRWQMTIKQSLRTLAKRQLLRS